MVALRSIAPFIFLTAWPIVLTAQDALVRTSTTLVLTKATDGFDGTLELVQDARVTHDLEKALWRMGPPDMVLAENDPVAKDLATRPLLNAVLQLRDAHRHVVSEKAMDGPLTRIRFVALIPSRRTIFATTDLSAGFGSYSGPATELFDAREGKLATVQVKNASTGEVGPFTLAATLKTDWKLVPAVGGTQGQKDILEAACRPDFDSPRTEEQKFWITYIRYHWDGKQWIGYSRKVHGFWEADEFPTVAHFPAATTSKR